MTYLQLLNTYYSSLWVSTYVYNTDTVKQTNWHPLHGLSN